MQNEAALTLQPEDVHTMVYTRLNANAVYALSASCKRLYSSLKRQLVSVLATVVPRELARIAAVALTLTESSEVRPFIMSCPTTAPPDDEDFSFEWMDDAWTPTGFLGRLTRTWSLPEQAVTFIECRPLERGDASSAGEDFVCALDSEDHYSLEYDWGIPADTLVNRCGSPQEKATLLRHIFAGLELKTPVNVGRAMHVMAAGPSHQSFGEPYDEPCYLWEWDRANCPILEYGDGSHSRDTCAYCSYSSAPLATVTQLFAADWSVEEQVGLVQAIVGKWGKCEQLIFVSHFTVSMPSASRLALAAVALPAVGLGSPRNLSSAFLGLFDFICEPMYNDSHDMRASDEVRRICFDFLKQGLHEQEFSAFLDCVKASKPFSNMLVDDACECDLDRCNCGECRGNGRSSCSCIDAKRERMEVLVRLLVSEDKCKAWCKTNLKVEVVTTLKVTCTIGKKSKTIVLK